VRPLYSEDCRFLDYLEMYLATIYEIKCKIMIYCHLLGVGGFLSLVY
jgi:hypothetical protein